MQGGRLQKPRRLKHGDIVQVIAPASPFRREKLAAGATILEAFGLRPRWRDDIFSVSDYLAGDDARRADELEHAFTDPDVAAVLPIRGGYGCVRTCRALAGRDNFGPRMFVGFSDITTIHMFLNGPDGLITFHGPNVSTLSSLDPTTLDRYRCTLFGLDPRRTYSWDGLGRVTGGRATGRTLVGNLTVLASLVGTAFEPDVAGRILIIEDLNERPYRVDRLLFQLSSLGGFKAVSAVVFGDFMLQDEDGAQLARTIAGYAESWGVPVATGFPIGHGGRNDCVPQGVPAELDTDRGRLLVEDPWSV